MTQTSHLGAATSLRATMAFFIYLSRRSTGALRIGMASPNASTPPVPTSLALSSEQMSCSALSATTQHPSAIRHRVSTLYSTLEVALIIAPASCTTVHRPTVLGCRPRQRQEVATTQVQSFIPMAHYLSFAIMVKSPQPHRGKVHGRRNAALAAYLVAGRMPICGSIEAATGTSSTTCGTVRR